MLRMVGQGGLDPYGGAGGLDPDGGAGGLDPDGGAGGPGIRESWRPVPSYTDHQPRPSHPSPPLPLPSHILQYIPPSPPTATRPHNDKLILISTGVINFESIFLVQLF